MISKLQKSKLLIDPCNWLRYDVTGIGKFSFE